MKRHTAARALAVGAFTASAALVLAGCGQGFSDDGGGGGGARRRRAHELRGLAHDPHRLERRRGDGRRQRGRRGLVEGIRCRGRGRWSPTTCPSSSRRASPAATRRTSSTSRPSASRATRATARSWRTATMLENKDDFYPSLVENFTVDDDFYCAPKDFSTLALVINKGLWDAAGLTEDDIPTTWDELADVAARRSRRTVWSASPSDAEYQRLGTFMAQAGGGLVSDDGEGDRQQPGERRSPHLRAGAAERRLVRLRDGRSGRRMGRRGVRQAARPP